jgi:hypothetical protein
MAVDQASSTFIDLTLSTRILVAQYPDDPSCQVLFDFPMTRHRLRDSRLGIR